MKIIHEDSDGRYIVVMDHLELCSVLGCNDSANLVVGDEEKILDVKALRNRLVRAFDALKPIVGDDS